jgi:hypothetical protein
MVRFVTVDKMATESGYTRNAIYKKCNDGVWRQGEVWHRAPDGRILIDVEGYERWVSGGITPIVKPEPPKKRRSDGEPPQCMLKPLA